MQTLSAVATDLLASADKKFIDVHIDELVEGRTDLRGEALLKHIAELLKRAHSAGQTASAGSLDLLRVMAYAPVIDESETVVPWNDALIVNIGSSEEPPSIYYYKNPTYWGEQLLDDGIEEYRLTLHLPYIETAIYRCYRNRNDDVFQSGCYLML